MSDPYHVRLALGQYGDVLRAELFTEDLGDTEGDLFNADWDQVDNWLPVLQGGGSDLPADAVRKLGQELYEKLLGGRENAAKWQEILDRANRDDRPIRLLI